MKTLMVFDPAMCCSTGVCGTDVDQALVDFSADVQWLKQCGVQIERFNLAQQPMSFVQNEGNDSNLLIVFYVQIMPDDFVMQLHRF